MNAQTAPAPAATPLNTPPRLQLNQARLSGRLTAIRKAGRSFEHLLILPAFDAYSHPQTVAVMADVRLGELDSDVTVTVSVQGFGRSYQATDEDGNKRRVTTAQNVLRAIL